MSGIRLQGYPARTWKRRPCRISAAAVVSRAVRRDIQTESRTEERVHFDCSGDDSGTETAVRGPVGARWAMPVEVLFL